MTSQVLTAEIPLAGRGLNGSKNQTTIPPNALIEARNISYEAGTIQREGGAAKYNSSAISGTPAVVGGFDWFPTSGTQRMIVATDDGKLLKDSGAGTFPTTLKSGLTLTNNEPVFVEGGKEVAANDRKLFIFSASNQVQVLAADGATTSDLTTPPADWSASFPSFGFIHEDTLWGGGNTNDPHRLYYSTVSDHEDFTGAGSGTVSIFPGEGDALVWGVSFKGFILVAKKPKGLYWVDTRDADVGQWRVQKLNDRIGSCGAHNFAIIDDDIVFVDSGYNWHLVSRVTDETFGTKSLSSVDQMQDFFRDRLNLGEIKNARMVYYSAKREVHCAIAQTTDTTNTGRIVLDLNNEQLPRFRFSDYDTHESLWLRQDTDGIQRPVYGDDAGFVFDMDQETKLIGTDGYTAEFQTPHMDLSHLEPTFAKLNKNGKWVEIVYQSIGNFDLFVDIYWDGVLKDTVTFNMLAAGATLGSFVLGTDMLSGNTVINSRKRITGSGRRISIGCRQTGDAEDFNISRLFLHFKPGNEAMTL